MLKTFAAVLLLVLALALKTFAAVLLLVLALALPALAGPPEGVSGKMVFTDEVAEGLRKYRQEKDATHRLAWLEKLAPLRDPRVAIALGDAMDSAEDRAGAHSLAQHAAALLNDFYAHPPGFVSGPFFPEIWWEMHKADLRRRAKQLPQ